jgi:hypothetical protein
MIFRNPTNALVTKKKELKIMHEINFINFLLKKICLVLKKIFFFAENTFF